MKELERKHAKLITHHIFESPLKTGLSHCIEKTMLAGDIIRKTVL